MRPLDPHTARGTCAQYRQYNRGHLPLLALLTCIPLAGSCAEETAPSDPEADQPSDLATASAPGLPAAPAEEAEDPENAAEYDLGLLETLGYAGFAEEEPTNGSRSGVLERDGGSSPGYDLVTSIGPCVADLYGPDGHLVHSWTLRGADNLTRAQLLPNGDLLAIGAGRAAEGAELSEDQAGIRSGTHSLLARLAWDGSERWRRTMRAHHDVELTPGGQILVLTESPRDIGREHLPHGIVDNSLTLLDGDGNTLEALSVYDILTSNPDEFLLRLNRRCPDDRPCDVFHANSVEWMARPELFGEDPLFDPGHVLVSLRHQNLVFIADYPTGTLRWAWGPGEVALQHEATLTASGNVLLFDNGTKRRGYSRVLEVDPRTRQITWEYQAARPEDLFSPARGTVQELPNGNVLVGDSVDGEAFEVTRSGEVVWRFANPRGLEDGRHRAALRIERYPVEYVEPLLAR